MCISCGQGDPYDNHGDRRNITQYDLDEAARAARLSSTDVARNILNSQYYPQYRDSER